MSVAARATHDVVWVERGQQNPFGSERDRLTRGSAIVIGVSKMKHPRLRDSVTLVGFITAMEVDKVVADQLGPDYLGQKIAWGS